MQFFRIILLFYAFSIVNIQILCTAGGTRPHQAGRNEYRRNFAPRGRVRPLWASCTYSADGVAVFFPAHILLMVWIPAARARAHPHRQATDLRLCHQRDLCDTPSGHFVHGGGAIHHQGILCTGQLAEGGMLTYWAQAMRAASRAIMSSSFVGTTSSLILERSSLMMRSSPATLFAT